jgi:prepilin-type N-terminal cleavage/methylation domain-containing protein
MKPRRVVQSGFTLIELVVVITIITIVTSIILTALPLARKHQMIEADIQQLSRCFTGWEIRRGQFRFNPYQHDDGVKTLFGEEVRSGEEAVDRVLAHRELPYFIARKLVRFFICDEPEADDHLIAPLARRQVEIETKYAGYIRRQLGEIEKQAKVQSVAIPQTFDFRAVPQLRFEAKEKLSQVRPRNLGQAGRISGITPADLAVLMLYLKEPQRMAS